MGNILLPISPSAQQLGHPAHCRAQSSKTPLVPEKFEWQASLTVIKFEYYRETMGYKDTFDFLVPTAKAKER